MKNVNLFQNPKMSHKKTEKIVQRDLKYLITETKQLLMQNGIKPAYESKPTTKNFKNVRRGLLGARRELY